MDLPGLRLVFDPVLSSIEDSTIEGKKRQLLLAYEQGGRQAVQRSLTTQKEQCIESDGFTRLCEVAKLVESLVYGSSCNSGPEDAYEELFEEVESEEERLGDLGALDDEPHARRVAECVSVCLALEPDAVYATFVSDEHDDFKFGLNLFHYAARFPGERYPGQPVLTALLEHIRTHRCPVLNVELANSYWINQRGSDDHTLRTPIHVAIEMRNLEALKLLVEAGFDSSALCFSLRQWSLRCSSIVLPSRASFAVPEGEWAGAQLGVELKGGAGPRCENSQAPGQVPEGAQDGEDKLSESAPLREGKGKRLRDSDAAEGSEVECMRYGSMAADRVSAYCAEFGRRNEMDNEAVIEPPVTQLLRLAAQDRATELLQRKAEHSDATVPGDAGTLASPRWTRERLQAALGCFQTFEASFEEFEKRPQESRRRRITGQPSDRRGRLAPSTCHKLNLQGRLPLEFALEYGDGGVLSQLLEWGADPFAVSSECLRKAPRHLVQLLEAHHKLGTDLKRRKDEDCGRRVDRSDLTQRILEGARWMQEVHARLAGELEFKQREQLHAARSGNLARVKLLQDKGYNFRDARDKYGFTPLHWAVYENHEAVVCALLHPSAPVEWSALDVKDRHLLRSSRKVHASAPLLCTTNRHCAPADPNLRCFLSNSTPLHLAVENNNLRIAQLLLAAGAYTRVGYIRNANPMENLLMCHSEAQEEKKKKKNLRSLLRRADSEAQEEEEEEDCAVTDSEAHSMVFPPREGADGMSHMELLGQLDWCISLEGKWRMLAEAQGYKVTMQQLVDRYTEELNDRDPEEVELTLLQRATCAGSSRAMRALIAANADLRVRTPDEDSLLHLAAKHGHVEAISVFIGRSWGTSDINEKNTMWNTPLHEAAQRGHLEVINALMGVGADVNLENRKGRTPLQEAARGGHLEVIKALVQAGCDIRTLSESEMHIAMSRAVADGDVSMVEALLTAESSQAPLMIALDRGLLDVARLLLEAGADANVLNQDGFTPLIAAAEEGKPFVVSMLLQAGADVNRAGSAGQTAVYQACQEGHTSIVQMCIQHGADVNLAMHANMDELAYVADHFKSKVAKRLLERPEYMVCMKRGFTPLVIAAIRGSTEIVQMCLDAGAHIHTHIHGHSALQWVQPEDHSEVEELLADAL
ncbi:hypothetical protein CYMTET_51916 [Cymbomonas tetramitiformis]|uniref:Uncharacterized protein n=1 Tax=Cymbomonas tetramitiformis TaxID=36881 RepID=A0AAE0BK20_9CHLO|nr:hypothetical protein CYMTET_51916 [Cymbomonas tetramitiformis]